MGPSTSNLGSIPNPALLNQTFDEYRYDFNGFNPFVVAVACCGSSGQ